MRNNPNNTIAKPKYAPSGDIFEGLIRSSIANIDPTNMIRTPKNENGILGMLEKKEPLFTRESSLPDFS